MSLKFRFQNPCYNSRMKDKNLKLIIDEVQSQVSSLKIVLVLVLYTFSEFVHEHSLIEGLKYKFGLIVNKCLMETECRRRPK